MAPIKLDRKSRLKFGLYCYDQDDIFSSMSCFQILWWASWMVLMMIVLLMLTVFHTFTLSNQTIHTFTQSSLMMKRMMLMVMLTVWESCWTFLCCPLCDFNHPPTRQSKDPIAPHMPMPTRTPPPNSKSLKLFWEKKSDVSPKREATRYKFNQGHHSKGFPMLNSAFWTCQMACGLWKPRCRDDSPDQESTRLIF